MGVERRRESAAGLRRLFQTHWDHLTLLIEQRMAGRESARRRALIDEGAVDTLVDGTNTLLRLVSGYKNRLRKSVHQVLDHVDQLVSRLPPPIEVGSQRFVQDPRVNAFFVNVESIRSIFSQSHELQSYFADPLFSGNTHAYAVMFMTKVEKEVLGSAMVGNILRQDVRKTTVRFTDHKILQPRESEALARQALERFLFESLVNYLNYRLARLGIGEAGGSGPCAELARTSGEGPPNLKDPEIYLQYLCKALDSHRELLRLEASSIRVNRIGEKVADDSRQLAHELNLDEIRLGLHGHEVITLVSYPRNEMIPRDELLRRASAHLMI